ncbi:ATP-binding protein [Hymenobacter sp. BT507]|uniref:ATP-binding protein n=1 Tax=Hymenobacter citatus TaxID=2763506 RepID=A0ABR7MJP2_9BACT|nr:ATP-binding protein [Hymenobacter citatus]MBC6610960.1 ATP-binding protein [Hymenobacter citatus]
MAKKHSLSVNINRDAGQDLVYVPTPNAVTVFGQLVSNYLAGIHCFNIVGAYGTGKSAFLWAFEQTLTRQKDYFKSDVAFRHITSFRFEQFVGQYASLKEVFAAYFSPNLTEDATSADVIEAIDQQVQLLAKKGQALVIVVDEFGKFLEYAVKENPEAELYFIQELAEYINDVDKNVMLVTTVHQDVSSYAQSLKRTQQQEWEKVKGRLKELTFNEPVEQLLYLASQRLSEKNVATESNSNSGKQLFEAIKAAKVFPLHDYFTLEVQQRVWPLDILSAAILVLALQKYGQNERSLFSFLESNDYLGIQDHTEEDVYYGLSSIHDYLIHHYYSLLSSRYNPHYGVWASIKTTLDRLEGLLEEGIEDARKLVKTIGLLSIFSPAGAEINRKFITAYAALSLGMSDPGAILEALEKHKLIRFVNHKKSYILFEGTDLDIDLAIDAAGQLVEQVTDVAKRLKDLFIFPYVAAKEVTFKKGTPRIFEIRVTDHVLLEVPQGEVDGFVNLIFSDSLTPETLRQTVGDRHDAVLYGLYRRSGEIKKLIREIDKIAKVKEENFNDRVAIRELDGILNHQQALLNHYVLDSLYKKDSKDIEWFFNGPQGPTKPSFQGRREFNRCLSHIAHEVYSATPQFRSELVNRTKLSSAIATARKSYVRALFTNWQWEDLGFEPKKYPPEKTIYLSLLKQTGIHQVSNGEYTLAAPVEESFTPLWQASERFLSSTQDGPLRLSDFVQKLQQKPLKLKQGFIDFWLPTFLFMKRHEYALYGEQDRYIPELTPEVVDLFTKNPTQYSIKAFSLEEEKLALFNDYRQLLQLSPAEQVSNVGFIESIKPFLTFYRQLPSYTQRTRKLPSSAIRLREAVVRAKDPEAAFFDAFPRALGFSIQELQQNTSAREKYIPALQEAINKLRNAYSALLQRLESFIAKNVVGTQPVLEQYKTSLQRRFKGLSAYRLPSELKVFRERLMSELDDRETWLNSMANALLKKSLKDFEDSDELLFQERFQQYVNQLDNLCDLANANIDIDQEDAFRLEISAFGEQQKARIIRRPKVSSKEDATLEGKIREMLGEDKHRSLAILARLIKEQLSDEQ